MSDDGWRYYVEEAPGVPFGAQPEFRRRDDGRWEQRDPATERWVPPSRVEAVFRVAGAQVESWHPATGAWEAVTGARRDALLDAVLRNRHFGSDIFLDQVSEDEAMAAARALRRTRR